MARERGGEREAEKEWRDRENASAPVRARVRARERIEETTITRRWRFRKQREHSEREGAIRERQIRDSKAGARGGEGERGRERASKKEETTRVRNGVGERCGVVVFEFFRFPNFSMHPPPSLSPSPLARMPASSRARERLQTERVIFLLLLLLLRTIFF